MSQTLKNVLVAGLVSLAVALVAFGLRGQSAPSLTAGGTVENFPSHFTNGLYGGVTDQLSIDSSGNITTTGTLSVSSGDARAQLVQTGSVLSIASGSVHYTAAQFCDNTVIRHNVTGVGVTASNSADVWPTAAALIADCVPTAGDTRTFVLQNISDDATERITPTANTGIDFFIASSSALTLDRKDTNLIRFWNVNGSSVSFGFVKVEDTN